MIQLSSLLPVMPRGPVRPALLASGSASGFVLALGAPAAKDESQALPTGRQMLAEAGKHLPEPAIGAGSEDNEDTGEAQDARADGADIAFAWFAMAPARMPATAGFTPPAPAIEIRADTNVPHAAAAPPDLSAVAAPTDEADAEPGIPSAAGAPERLVAPTSAASPKPAIAEPPQMETLPVPVGDSSAGVVPTAEAAPVIPSAALAGSAAPIAQGGPARKARASAPVLEAAIQPAEKVPEQIRVTSPQGVSERVRTAPSQSPAAPPPLTPFNPAVLALAASAPAAPAPPRRMPVIDSAALALLPAVPETAQPHAVPAATDIQRGALDTRRQEWMGKMVEHIEALRDAAPMRETRLSLAPEALGRVDVSIRQEGDCVHVHFTTETPAARQLIADAQPRLNELAEARGLKLGQTSFESGAAGQGPNRENHGNPAPQQSPKPRTATDSAVGPADDERIA